MNSLTAPRRRTATAPFGPQLPSNISPHPRGYLIRVYRQGVLLQGFVPQGDPQPLTRALALRARFLRAAAAPAVIQPRVLGRSNTGLSGITEIQKWRGNRSYPCFSVSWNDRRRRRNRCIYYGPGQSRDAALRRAIALRSRMTGLVIPRAAGFQPADQTIQNCQQDAGSTLKEAAHV